MVLKFIKGSLIIASCTAILACGGGTSPKSTQSSSSSSGIAVAPNVNWILPTQFANAGSGTETQIEVMVSIDAPGSTIISASIESTNLLQSIDGLWTGTVKVPAGTSSLKLNVIDRLGNKTLIERPIYNNLYSAYSRAVEFDPENNRLLLTSWSSERLLELNLTKKDLQEIPIDENGIKQSLSSSQFLTYSPATQLAYFPDYATNQLNIFNTKTGANEAIPNSTGFANFDLCINPNTSDLFGLSFQQIAPEKVGFVLSRKNNQGITQLAFDPQTLTDAIAFGGIACQGDGTIVATGFNTNKFSIINPNTTQITQLDLSSIAPAVTNSQLRFKPFGTGSGYLLTLVGDNTSIYKANSITDTPKLITGVNSATGESRGTGAPIVWAWDATIDEAGNRIYTHDGEGIISVDIATGDRTSIFAESYTKGDLTGPMGLGLSQDRQYAYSFTLWNSSLRKTDLVTGISELEFFKQNGTAETFEYSKHHTLAAKYSSIEGMLYHLSSQYLSKLDLDGNIKNRIAAPASNVGSFDIDENTHEIYLVKNNSASASELLKVSFSSGTTKVADINTGKTIIGITRLVNDIFYLVDSEGTLLEFDLQAQTLTNLGTLSNAEFNKDHFVFDQKGRSASVLDKAKNRLYLSYGPNLFAMDITSKQLTPINTTGGTKLADISGLYLDPKYDILWATDSVLNSIVAIRNGVNLTVIR